MRGGRQSLSAFVVARLLASRKKSYVSLVSSISVWGLAVGVAALVSIFAVTTGFEEVFRDKILGVYPHMVVLGKGGDLPEWQAAVDRLAGLPRLRSVSPATYDEMMASHRGRRAGCIVKGMAAAAADVAKQVAPFLSAGSMAELAREPEFRLEGGVLAVPRLPGGSGYTVIVTPEEVEWEASFEEEGEVPKVRFRSALADAAEIVVEGVLTETSLAVGAGAASRWVEVGEGGTPVAINGSAHAINVDTGNHVIIVGSDQDGAYRLLACRAKAPGAGESPAGVCVANLSAVPVEVRAAERSVLVEAGQTGTVEVTGVELPRVLLGSELARNIEAQVGDEVRLVSPLTSIPGVTAGREKRKLISGTFVVAGLVHLGFYEYDSKLAVVDFAAARRLLHQGDCARWVEVRVDDLFAMPEHEVEVGRRLAGFSLLDVQEAFPRLVEKYEAAASDLSAPEGAAGVVRNVSAALSAVKYSNARGEMEMGYQDDYKVITWEEMNRPWFQSMKRQKLVLSLFFLIIIVVAAFNIVSSQAMIVNEKSGDIAILRAMGATARQVRRVFTLQGMAIGVAGTAAGLGMALLVCLFLSEVGFPLDPKVYFVSQLPVRLSAWDLVAASALSLATTYAAVVVAARRAERKSPAEGLRELE
jgi:lipoprotein-releasing system permease protein